MVKKCLNCSNNFKTYLSRTKIGKGLFCSKKCYQEYHCFELSCYECNKKYLYPKSQVKINFCSKFCLENNRKKKRIEKKCLKCDKGFSVLKTRLKNNRGKFCSTKCYWKSLIIPIELNKKNRQNYQRKYREQNREKTIIWKHKRRALQKEVGGYFNEKEWELLKNKYKYKCAICKKKKKLTVDHIIPLYRWFEWKKENKSNYFWNDIENIQPLCINCNSQKSWHIK